MKIIRKVASCIMAMAIICTLFALFALRSAHVYQLNMGDVVKSRGAV